jgi:hypothetical protein
MRAHLTFWTTSLNSLTSTYLWRRGLGRGGSFFNGRFMGRRLDQTRPSPCPSPRVAAGRGDVIGRAQRYVREVRCAQGMTSLAIFIDAQTFVY